MINPQRGAKYIKKETNAVTCHRMSVITVFIPVGWILPCPRSWGEWRDKVSCWPLGTPRRWRRHYLHNSRW